MRSTRRAMTGLLAALALTATACGARLTDEQYDVAVAAELGGGGGGGAAAGSGGSAVASGPVGSTGGGTTTGAGGGATDAGGSTGTSTDAGAGTDASAGAGAGDAGGAVDTGGQTSGGGDTGSAGGQTGGGTDTGDQAGGGTTDTRAMPAGGNGGATDVGVTETEITVFNVADVSGAVPNIFLDARLATQAYFAYFTSTEGTVYGRQINLVVRDSALDTGQNRSHYQDACVSAFAAVGSMSAFDEGVAGPVAECGIPDLRAASVNPATMDVPSVYSADAMSSQLFPTNHYLFWKEQNPGAEQKAAMLYLQNDTTRAQTRLMIGASQKVGYNYVVDEAIGLTETNYSSYVIQLKQNDVEFVQFQGDVQQAVRLAQAMRQQDYWPRVFALQQNLYQPKLIEQGGADIEEAQVAVGSALLEKIDQYPEMQTYREWLKRVSPQAEPTGMGMYSWSAASLFIDSIKKVGPNLTRAALLEELSKVTNFTGGGMLPPQEVGQKVPSNCHIIVVVQGGQFVQIDPPTGNDFVCRGKNESGS